MEMMALVLQNILLNPTEPRFKRLRTSNKRVVRTVTSREGAVSFLCAVGFEEHGLQHKPSMGKSRRSQEELQQVLS